MRCRSSVGRRVTAHARLTAVSLRHGIIAVPAHSMRTYYLPMTAGLALVISSFMPWVLIGEQPLGGVPDIAGLWVLGLGILAIVLAALSVITRKNSRHPLLLVGLAAFAIVLLTARMIERSAVDQAWAQSQARAIVQGQKVKTQPKPTMAAGAYLGLSAATFITLFGLTIVVRRVAHPYAASEDDDT